MHVGLGSRRWWWRGGRAQLGHDGIAVAGQLVGKVLDQAPAQLGDGPPELGRAGLHLLGHRRSKRRLEKGQSGVDGRQPALDLGEPPGKGVVAAVTEAARAISRELGAGRWPASG